MREKSVITGVNNYDLELSEEEIAKGLHRGRVGGFWEEVGILQLNYLKKQGLQPDQKLLDIGCGCLRGGLHFISYLEKNNYFGLDINKSLLKAALLEVNAANLQSKNPTLLLDESFAVYRFCISFDAMVAISLFTHLPTNMIMRCLYQAGKALKNKGRLYATFFIADQPLNLTPITHQPGNITTYYDQDPFHYSKGEIKSMARHCGLAVESVEHWGHPRSQQMVVFKKLRAPFIKKLMKTRTTD